MKRVFQEGEAWFVCSRCEMRALRAECYSLLSKWLIGWPRGSNWTQLCKKKLCTYPPEQGVQVESTPVPLNHWSYWAPSFVHTFPLSLPHLSPQPALNSSGLITSINNLDSLSPSTWFCYISGVYWKQDQSYEVGPVRLWRIPLPVQSNPLF